MFDVLINISVYTPFIAFVLIFVGSLKLFGKIRHWSVAGLLVGSGLLVLSQVLVFGAYKIFPPVYDSGQGIWPHEIRDGMHLGSMWLVNIGMLVAAVCFLIFSVKNK